MLFRLEGRQSLIALRQQWGVFLTFNLASKEVGGPSPSPRERECQRAFLASKIT